MTETAAMLEARDLWISLAGAPVLRGVSLRVEAGELLALCGPNGAGKSTLLSALSGERAPDQGSVTIDGRDVAATPPRALALDRAALEQSPSASAPFTVRALAGLGAEIAPHELDYDPAAAVADAISAARLERLAERRVDRLSGGESQRAHFARAHAQIAAGRAAGKGHVLLLDEPTASLDLNRQVELLRAAKALTANGAAVIAALHDLNLAAAFADRVALMKAGRIEACDAPARAFTAETLTAIYEIEIEVDQAPDGRPRVFPNFKAA